MDSEILHLNELSRKLFISDVDNAIIKATEAVELAKAKSLNIELAESLLTLSYVLSVQGNSITVLEYIFEAISILKHLDNKTLLIKAYSQLGTIYLINGDLERSFSAFMYSLQLVKELEKEVDDPSTLLGLGTILSFKESYDDSIEYYEKALKLAQIKGDIIVELKAINNLGYIHNLLDNLDKSEKYLTECIAKCKQEGHINIMVPALDELGIIYSKRGEDQRAVNIWEKAAELDKRRGETYVSIAPLIHLANYYIDIESWDSARSCIDRASIICLSINSDIELLEIYKAETVFYERKGLFKQALSFHKKYFEINKKIKSTEIVRTLKEVELEILTKSKDRIIALGKVGRTFTESLDMKTMLTRVHDQIGSLFDFAILGLARYDDAKKSLSYEMFIEDGITLPNFTTSINDEKSLGAWCIRNDERVVISNFEVQRLDYFGGGSFNSALITNGKKPKSVIIIPLKVGKEIIGLITLQSYKENAYSSEDIDIFDILASYAAIGLNNALQSAKIEEQNKKLSILATYDDLTGLKNRRSFFYAVNNFWSWSIRTKTPFSMILLDLDFFKNINDNFGHPAGDYCLVEIGRILKEIIKRDNDEVARVGGEEFGIFLGDTDEEGIFIIAEKIRSEIDNHSFIFNDKTLPVTASLGITTVRPWLEKEKDIDDIIIEADSALYAAKAAGRNCIKKFTTTG